MNGISRITAMIIVNREDLLNEAVGPNDSGLYSATVSLPEGRIILNTKPIFQSSECALSHLKKLKSNLKIALEDS